MNINDRLNEVKGYATHQNALKKIKACVEAKDLENTNHAVIQSTAGRYVPCVFLKQNQMHDMMYFVHKGFAVFNG